MKIIEAQKIYREYRQQLVDQTRQLVKQRDQAQEKYEVSGDTKFSEEAATLQLSIDETKEKFEDNQEVLDGLIEQWVAVFNAEVSEQQGDVLEEEAENMAKLMTVARRLSNGDKVPSGDEQKLMEYSFDWYLAAKSAGTMRNNQKPKSYDSLWEEEEDEKEYDPEGRANNAEASGNLPDIPDTSETVSIDIE